jgi:hypothetical protein
VLDYISKDKTETENYDEIMLRICKRLSAAKEEQEQTAENLKRLEELLDGVLWLYDNLLASEIATLLKNWSGGTRALERALAAACARVSSDTGLIDCGADAEGRNRRFALPGGIPQGIHTCFGA